MAAIELDDTPPPGCRACAGGPLGFGITMAFQPIVYAATGAVFAQEALVRGPGGESAASVLARVTPANRYLFDQETRTCAIRLAARLGVASALSINFMPNAVYQPEHCIRTTVAAAGRYGFPLRRVIFELSECERVEDPGHVRRIIDYYKSQGLLTAIDDFGAGYAGLALLADFLPDILKIDMALVRGIDRDRRRRAIVGGVLRVCRDLGITPVAEGVETAGEAGALLDLGVGLHQGYYFARPAFESLAAVGGVAVASAG